MPLRGVCKGKGPRIRMRRNIGGSINSIGIRVMLLSCPLLRSMILVNSDIKTYIKTHRIY